MPLPADTIGVVAAAGVVAPAATEVALLTAGTGTAALALLGRTAEEIEEYAAAEDSTAEVVAAPTLVAAAAVSVVVTGAWI